MERFPYGELKVFGGRSHPALTGEICRTLGRDAGRVTLYNFSDGENYCQIEENVRGADVFIVQPTGPPVNSNVMELLIMLDAFKRSSASRVTAVLSYYGYARQDRKDKPRVPITAKLVADLVVAAGADRVLCVDLHAAQIQGFFNVPVDHLFAAPVLLDAIRDARLDPLTVVSPDAGGVERARAFAKRLGAQLAIVDKRRKGKNEVEILHVIGDVRERNVIVVDDIIDAEGVGPRARLRRLRPSGPVGARDRPDQRQPDRADLLHEHAPARGQARALPAPDAPLHRPAPRRGDPAHPRGSLGVFVVRLIVSSTSGPCAPGTGTARPQKGPHRAPGKPLDRRRTPAGDRQERREPPALPRHDPGRPLRGRTRDRDRPARGPEEVAPKSPPEGDPRERDLPAQDEGCGRRGPRDDPRPLGRPRHARDAS